MKSIIPVSVIIPLYNGETYIKETLESVINQSIQPAEIIVIDDGSTDNSFDIVANYPVKIISQNNKGISGARNTGILAARCEWIALLDQDDIWFNNKLKLQWDILQAYTELDILFCDTLLLIDNQIDNAKDHIYRLIEETAFDEIGTNIYKLDSNKLCNAIKSRNIIMPSTLVARKSIIAAELFDENMIRAEDTDLFLRMFPKANVAMLYEPLVYYRLHQNNSSLDHYKMVLGFALLTEKIINNGKLYPEDIYTYFISTANVTYYDAGSRAIRRNDKLQARRYLLKSLKHKFCMKAFNKFVFSYLHWN